MDILLYVALFWVFGVAATVLKDRTPHPTPLRTVIKVIPAALAALFVISSESSASPFHIVLGLALVMCAAGDIGMEYNIVPGLGLFLIAHVLYVLNFLMMSVLLGLAPLPLAVTGLVYAMLCGYAILYTKYIRSSSQSVPEPLLKAVSVYALVISLTVAASLLLWLTSGAPYGFVPPAGAAVFVVSDSIVGVKELHHHFTHEELLVMPTYYLAVLLLSMAGVVFSL